MLVNHALALLIKLAQVSFCCLFLVFMQTHNIDLLQSTHTRNKMETERDLNQLDEERQRVIDQYVDLRSKCKNAILMRGTIRHRTWIIAGLRGAQKPYRGMAMPVKRVNKGEHAVGQGVGDEA